MTETHATDSQYYQVARPHSVAERVVIAARNRMYADFMRTCVPTRESTILDVGVSDVVTDAANFLERLYPHPEQITAAGIGDGAEFVRSYPSVRYTKIAPNTALPFADLSFDIATANAVLEHVGSTAHQEFFVRELMRIARSVFITVPHRYFPIEHHTGFPFLHYTDTTFNAACSLFRRTEWSREENLILMTHGKLTALIPKHTRYDIGYTGILLGPCSSNLYVHIRSV